MVSVVIARHEPAPRRRRPWHVQKPSAGEPGDLHRCPHHGAVFWSLYRGASDCYVFAKWNYAQPKMKLSI
jgi:hypothetical protein